MNKIYKVIWSTVRNGYVVVSELTKRRHNKSSSAYGSKAAHAILSTLVALGLLSPVFVSATDIATADNAAAIGWTATASVEDSITLGSGSLANRASGKAGWDFETGNASTATHASWKATKGAVAVGSTVNTRQIIGVAAGKADTDAVNVAQLKGVNTKVEKNKTDITNLTNQIEGSKVHYYAVNSTKNGAGTNFNNDGAKGVDSMVIGISSSVTGDKNGVNNSIVVGHYNEVEGTHNAVFGTDYANYDHKQTHIFGEHNTVLGIGNLVGYTAEKDSSDPTKWIYTKKNAGQDQNVVVGLNNTANWGSVVVGTSSEADSLGNSFGHGNKIYGMNDGGGQHGTALGSNLIVSGENALAAGYESEAKSDFSIALGSKSIASATNDIAIGTNSHAFGKWSIAMGVDSTAEKQTAVAMGYGAHAKVDKGIALGSYSVASTESNEIGYDPLTGKRATPDNMIWKSSLGAVSIGDIANEYTRQITGVAAGKADTDAVNVAQLKALEEKMTDVASTAGKPSSVTTGANLSVDSSKTNTKGGTEYKVSLNKDVDLSADGSLTVGDTQVNKNGMTIAGGPTITKTNVDMGNQQVHGVADATHDTDAVNLRQLNAKIGNAITQTAITGGEIKEDGTLALKKGGGSELAFTGKLKDVSVKAGTYEIENGDVTIGLQDNYSKKAAGNLVIKDVAKASALNQEVIDRKAADKVITDTIGAENSTKLKESFRGTTYIKDSSTLVDANIALDKAIKQQGQAIDHINTQVIKVNDKVNKVGAGAAALAALHPLDFDPDNKWDIAAGYGNYRGANAAALGAYYRPNEDMMWSIGASIGGGENMVNAGLSMKVGSGTPNRAAKVNMAKEIKELRQQVAKQDAQIEELKALVAQIMDKK